MNTSPEHKALMLELTKLKAKQEELVLEIQNMGTVLNTMLMVYGCIDPEGDEYHDDEDDEGEDAHES